MSAQTLPRSSGKPVRDMLLSPWLLASFAVRRVVWFKSPIMAKMPQKAVLFMMIIHARIVAAYGQDLCTKLAVFAAGLEWLRRVQRRRAGDGGRSWCARCKGRSRIAVPRCGKHRDSGRGAGQPMRKAPPARRQRREHPDGWMFAVNLVTLWFWLQTRGKRGASGRLVSIKSGTASYVKYVRGHSGGTCPYMNGRTTMTTSGISTHREMQLRAGMRMMMPGWPKQPGTDMCDRKSQAPIPHVAKKRGWHLSPTDFRLSILAARY